MITEIRVATKDWKTSECFVAVVRAPCPLAWLRFVFLIPALVLPFLVVAAAVPVAKRFEVVENAAVAAVAAVDIDVVVDDVVDIDDGLVVVGVAAGQVPNQLASPRFDFLIHVLVPLSFVAAATILAVWLATVDQ